MNNIALVVVLYNPNQKEVKENIDSYADAVSLIITVDNSESSTHNLEESEKIIHIRNNENAGIAKALNQGIIKAQELNYKYVVLMDQDSSFFNAKASISALYDALQDKETNFMSSSVVVNADIEPKEHTEVLRYIDSCITSGSMLKLSLIDKIGLHDEKLFIDYVDFEYSLRARKLGYTIVETKNSRLKHLIGESKKVSMKLFPLYKTYTTNHSPLRRYYRWRNAAYVWKMYQDSFPKWVNKNRKQTFSDMKKIILFEDNKIEKIKACLAGLKDAKNGVFGKKENL